MSELSDTVESAQSFVTEVEESQDAGEEHPRWHKHVALTTLIIALLSALGALLAGMRANEALMDRTEEIIEVNHLEGKRIYVETLKSKHEILIALGETPDQAEIETVLAFEKEVHELELQDAREEMLALAFARSHQIFAIAVALLSLGTGLCSMSIIANRKLLWGAGIVFGAVGAGGMGMGVLMLLF